MQIYPLRQALSMTTVSICLYGVLAAIALAASVTVQTAACLSCLLHYIRQASVWQIWLCFACMGILLQFAHRALKAFLRFCSAYVSTNNLHPPCHCLFCACFVLPSLARWVLHKTNQGVVKFCNSHASLQTKLVRHMHLQIAWLYAALPA